MAPKHPHLGSPGTPAFLARMMAIPALNDAFIFASHLYDNTKQDSNEYVRAALLAAEEGVRAAATGALPLAAPIVERVGGWEAVDDWACRGIDRVAQAAPIITKPTEEIVSTTRERMLMAVAGTGTVPTSLSAALSARASSTVEFMSKLSGGQAATGVAERIVNTANTLLDRYLPAKPGDPRDTVADSGSVGALLAKTRRRLYRTMHNVAYPKLKHTRESIDGSFSVSLLYDFGRQAASTLYSEINRQPERGEEASLPMRLARSTFQMNLQIRQRLGPDLQRSVANMQESFKSRDLNRATREMIESSRIVLMNTWNWGTNLLASSRIWVEDSLRQAMAAYEQRERMAALNQQRVRAWQPGHSADKERQIRRRTRD
ncbi:perilipin-2-like isoform X1 [Penaeus chinensis]|uniref:perilipin-2-like isoform X1 n=1 Tax=Penaeus chinensis TaxID=139456 RepID=UPI001FB70592|nr:perilipin-2-like isoform X1 [Penaeus chinensis]